MVSELAGKVVVVTGGANGIGAAVIRRLLEEGAKHAAILDIAENGPAFEEELNGQYGAGVAKFYRCDVTDDEQLASALRGAAARGGPHLVLNNAGIMNDKLYKKQIELNLTASITSTLKAIELMRKDKGGGGGTVVNVSSTAGLTLLPFMPVYWSTKSAILQFSSCIGMPKNYSRTGVRVMTICFGATAGTSILLPGHYGTLDEHMAADHQEHIRNVSTGAQPLEFAVNGLIHMLRHGESGSTWLSARSRPARDITALVRERSDAFKKILYSLGDDDNVVAEAKM